MTQNPYESSAVPAADVEKNSAAIFGLVLANFATLGIAAPGLLAEFAGGPVLSDVLKPICIRIQLFSSFLVLPAALVSSVGLMHRPRKLAICGLGVCTVGSLMILKLFLQWSP